MTTRGIFATPWRGESVFGTAILVGEDDDQVGYVSIYIDEGSQQRDVVLESSTAREMADALYAAADAADTRDRP